MKIGDINISNKEGLSHMSALIDNESLWFESSDIKLNATPEVYGAGLLFSSLSHNDQLQIEDAVSPKWLNGVEKILPIFNRWWDYPILLPEASVQEPLNNAPLSNTAVCFTGGVDSFYSLLHSSHEITHIVFAYGYDISLNDTVRMASYEKAMREIARLLDVKPIIVTTNLREHPSYLGVNWEHSHGSALASIGYLLSNEVGTLVIPASYTYDNEHPWGSNWRTDSLWSTENLNVVHDDATYGRIDKLKYIVDEPLVKQHLRVCWEKRSSLTGNCSECEKCIRTMIGISAWAPLEEFSAFDQSVSLANRIDRLSSISPHIEAVYHKFLNRDLDDDVKLSIVRLLKRSRKIKIRRKLIGVLKKIFRRVLVKKI